MLFCLSQNSSRRSSASVRSPEASSGSGEGLGKSFGVGASMKLYCRALEHSG